MWFKHVRRKITWPLTHLAVVGFKIIVSILPFHLLHVPARVIGFLLLLFPAYKKLIMVNLEIAFPDMTNDERVRLCKRSAVNLCLTFVEFLWIRGNFKKIDSVISMLPHSVDLLDKYSKMNEGVMVISPHIGNWELGNVYVNIVGYHTWTVAKEQHNPFMATLIDDGRKLSGAKIIHEIGAAKTMMRVLKNGETVMLLIDQNTPPKKGGTFVEFFGLPVAVSRAPLSFARRCKANVIVGGCIRSNSGLLKIDFRELPKPATEYANDDELCRAIMKIHEEFVRKTPDQYLWLYKRFRYVPSNWQGDRSKFPYYHRIYDTENKK